MEVDVVVVVVEVIVGGGGSGGSFSSGREKVRDIGISVIFVTLNMEIVYERRKNVCILI